MNHGQKEWKDWRLVKTEEKGSLKGMKQKQSEAFKFKRVAPGTEVIRNT